MFMVLILHLLGHGGVLDNSVINSSQYHVAWLLELGAYCAVNVFALTTGYLMINRKFKVGRIISLWLQVIFYSLAINVVFTLFSPGAVSGKQWIKSCFPVSFKLWWYFTAYFALFFLTPFINKMLNALSKRQTIILIIVLCTLYSVISTILPNDIFQSGGGYSVVWLVVLYILGGAIKKYNFAQKVKKRWWAIAYFACVIAVWLSRIVIRWATIRLLGYSFHENGFVSYTSPFVLAMAVALLLLFRNTKFPKWLNKTVAVISPLSFAVYIIHQHTLFINRFFVGKFVYLASSNVFVLVGTVIGVAILVFAFCVAVEWVRVQIFKWTRMNKLVEKTGNKLDKWIALEEEKSKEPE